MLYIYIYHIYTYIIYILYVYVYVYISTDLSRFNLFSPENQRFSDVFRGYRNVALD